MRGIERKATMILRMPLEKRRWLEHRAAETGETMTGLVLEALEAAQKRHERSIERGT